uniref:Secreted protein n=1 Tax=Anguilla anguilla TaxID=7936 RepID=A0A0E9WLZ0_ANGAN
MCLYHCLYVCLSFCMYVFVCRNTSHCYRVLKSVQLNFICIAQTLPQDALQWNKPFIFDMLLHKICSQVKRHIIMPVLTIVRLKKWYIYFANEPIFIK